MSLTPEQIARLEAPLEDVSLPALRERIDEVIGKDWGFQYEGPELVEVPKGRKRPIKTDPERIVYEMVPHYKCSCTIMLFVIDGTPIVREYTLLVPLSAENAYELAREMSFIYAAHHGWGVGKRTAEVFADEPEICLVMGPAVDELTATLEELATLKAKLGISKNADLDPFVDEWSAGELSSHRSISKANLKAFTQFLSTKVPEHVRESTASG